MPAERVSMRRIREILRLKSEGGASDRQIARSLSLARSTVALTLERAAAARLRWPLPATLADRVLAAQRRRAPAGGFDAPPAPALSSAGDGSRPHHGILDRKITARLFRRRPAAS